MRRWSLLRALLLSCAAALLLVSCAPSAQERLEAVWAAADGGDVASLRSALGDNDDAIRAEAVRALARSSEPTAAEALESFAEQASEPWRHEVVVSLADSGRVDDGVVAALLPYLSDAAPPIRAAALLGLAEGRPLGRETLEPMVALLADTDPGVRTAAQEALRLQGWAAADALAARLTAPKGVAPDVLRRLLKDGTGQTLPDEEWEAWLAGPVATLRRVAATGTWPAAKAALVAGLRAETPDVRQEALLALTPLAPPDEAVALIAAELVDDVEFARAAGLWGAAAREALIERLTRPGKVLGSDTFAILVTNAGPDVIPIIAARMDARDTEVAAAAIAAVAGALRTGGTLTDDVRTRLVRALESPAPHVADEAALALWASGSPRTSRAEIGRRFVTAMTAEPLPEAFTRAESLTAVAEYASWLNDEELRLALVARFPTALSETAEQFERALATLRDTPELADVLVERVLNEPGDWPPHAIRAALACSPEKAGALLLRLAKSPHPYVRLSALDNAATRADRLSPAAATQLASAGLASAATQEQLRGVRIVRARRLNPLADRLPPLLRSRNVLLVPEVAETLATLGHREAVPDLLKLLPLVEGRSAGAVASALASFDKPAGFDWLRARMSRGPVFPHEVPKEFVLAFALRREDASRSLKTHTNNVSMYRTTIALAELLKHESPGAEEAWHAASNGSERRTALAAGRWLGRHGEPAHVRRLGAAAARASSTVEGASSLGLLHALATDDEAAPEMARAAQAELWTLARGPAANDVRLRALEILADMAPERLEELRAIVDELLSDHHGSRTEFAGPLGKLGLCDAVVQAAQERIAQEPESPNALNGAAWSVVTCDGASADAHTLAFGWAKRAAALSQHQDCHVLDTLALAAYRTGRRELAIETQLRALRRAAPGERREYAARLRAFVSGHEATGREGKER